MANLLANDSSVQIDLHMSKSEPEVSRIITHGAGAGAGASSGGSLTERTKARDAGPRGSVDLSLKFKWKKKKRTLVNVCREEKVNGRE